MKIKLGDKVRSCGGVEGEIVLINDDRRSVMVKVPGIWRGSGIVSIPLVRLTQIAAYTVEREQGGNSIPWTRRFLGIALGLLCVMMFALLWIFRRGGP